MYQYRAFYYLNDEKRRFSSPFDNVDQALNHLVEMKKFAEYTRGDIEIYMWSIGWVPYCEAS